MICPCLQVELTRACYSQLQVVLATRACSEKRQALGHVPCRPAQCPCHFADARRVRRRDRALFSQFRWAGSLGGLLVIFTDEREEFECCCCELIGKAPIGGVVE